MENGTVKILMKQTYTHKGFVTVMELDTFRLFEIC